MSVEMSLLRAMRHKDQYDRLIGMVPMDAIDGKTAEILRAFKSYFDQSGAEEIDAGSFSTHFFLRFPSLKDESRAIYSRMFSAMMHPNPEGVSKALREQLLATDYAARITTMISEWNAGKEIDLCTSVRAVADQFEQEMARKVAIPWVRASIADVLAEEENDSGISFRLSILHQYIRKLRPGDFIVWAGRPDKGKTSSIASELTYMIPQLDEYPEYWEPGKATALWFNNEGPGKRIVSRCYQAALGMSIPDMVKAHVAGEKLDEKYAELMGGEDRLRVMDIHGMWHHEVEDIIKQTNPGIIVFDMVDNIKFGGEVQNGGQRTDQLLEAMYQWARIIGVKYNAIVIATSQISNEGDGLAYPNQSYLKDSKTGKQGAADMILMLGASNEPSMASTRFISFPKCKLRRAGAGECRLEVLFNRDTSRLCLPDA